MDFLLCLLALGLLFLQHVSADFYSDIDITFGADHIQILDDGQTLHLSLDNTSGSGFQSKNEYLFGKIDMEIKLVPNNSAGTVTAFYLSSEGDKQDEIDVEFLGNLSGNPYVMQTNVYLQGDGNREQQLYLWFDPTTGFHNYSLLWSPRQILFSVDGIAVRVFENNEDLGVAYPKNQAMRIRGSLWNGDSWATRGGAVKIDWSKAPFVASFANFSSADACVSNSSSAK
ncbi:hypothetical protein KI387_014670, partial [Taxus chinensis]